MSDSRPVNLDLMTIKMPVTAVASITHRVCAVITWAGLGFLLFLASSALESQQGFDSLAVLLKESFLMQVMAWGLLSAFGYYCVGTVKHLIQDLGYFEDLLGGQLISWASLGGGGLMCLISGGIVWG